MSSNNWIEIDEEISDFLYSDKCRVGMLIKVRQFGEEKILLIGDLTDSGGQCSCCGIKGRVTAYKVIYDKMDAV